MCLFQEKARSFSSLSQEASWPPTMTAYMEMPIAQLAELQSKHITGDETAPPPLEHAFNARAAELRVFNRELDLANFDKDKHAANMPADLAQAAAEDVRDNAEFALQELAQRASLSQLLLLQALCVKCGIRDLSRAKAYRRDRNACGDAIAKIKRKIDDSPVSRLQRWRQRVLTEANLWPNDACPATHGEWEIVYEQVISAPAHAALVNDAFLKQDVITDKQIRTLRGAPWSLPDHKMPKTKTEARRMISQGIARSRAGA